MRTLLASCFFLELFAQLEFFDVVEQLEDFFVGAVAERAEESRGEKFPAALASIEINVKQVAGIELHFIHEPRSGMMRKL